MELITSISNHLEFKVSSDSDCNEIENDPKRRRVLRKRKEVAGCSYDFDLDSNDDLYDFQCSGESADQTWKPNESDYDFDDDSTLKNSDNIVLENPRNIDDEIARCDQPSQILTLCTATTESNAVAGLTVNEGNTEDSNVTNAAIATEEAIISKPKGIMNPYD